MPVALNAASDLGRARAGASLERRVIAALNAAPGRGLFRADTGLARQFFVSPSTKADPTTTATP